MGSVKTGFTVVLKFFCDKNMQMQLQSETEKIIFCCTSNMRYMYMYGTTRHKNRYLYHTYIVNVQAHQLVRFVGQQGSLHLVKIG